MDEDTAKVKQYRYISIALSPEEKWEIDRLAATDGMSTSDYVRRKLSLPLIGKSTPKQPKAR